MVKIQLHCTSKLVTISVMIDLGATEDFINKEVCNKQGLKMIKGKCPTDIYFRGGNSSIMGPVTLITGVSNKY